MEQENKTQTNENLIDKANAAAERLERATARLEEIQAERILAGQTNAGQQEPEKKEVSPEDYSDAALKGQVLD